MKIAWMRAMRRVGWRRVRSRRRRCAWRGGTVSCRPGQSIRLLIERGCYPSSSSVNSDQSSVGLVGAFLMVVVIPFCYGGRCPRLQGRRYLLITSVLPAVYCACLIHSSLITSSLVCIVHNCPVCSSSQDPLGAPPLPNRLAPIAPKSAKLLEAGVKRRRVDTGVPLLDIGIDALPRFSLCC